MKSLQESKSLRITTLCMLYFAQGFPWGFMTTALVAYLAEQGLSIKDTGYLISMAVLPWTFKLFWAPLIDIFSYPEMGRRRPWIIGSQFMMGFTLITMGLSSDLTSNINILARMFFIHNCFASLQDVSSDALAIDILPENERGKVNGLMWGSKIIGVGFGTSVMGTLLVHTSLNATILFQAALIIIVMLFPLLIRERNGEKLFPWSKGQTIIISHATNIRSPLSICTDLIKGFSVRSTFSAALFILLAFIGSGISSAFLPNIYTNTLGWKVDTYSQVIGIPGTIFEFCGALVGGYVADKVGLRRIIIMGYGAYGVLTIIFGLLFDYWTNSVISTAYLILYPGCISFGTVAVFSLFMKISWTRAAATMFTSYMAMANLSTTIGTRLAGSLDDIMEFNKIFILVGVFSLLPLCLLYFIDSDKILKLKVLDKK